LPAVDVIYLADQAHVPYGDRSPESLLALLGANVAYLENTGVEAIVMGCNTSCAVANRFGWPAAHVPIFDLIQAVARSVAGSGARRVGVIATAATVESGAYGNAIRRAAEWVRVQEVAAPALVPLVEAGTLTGPVARAAVEAACAKFEPPLDALVLACTHYPLLREHFTAVLGKDVVLIDPAFAQAGRAAAFARGRNPRSRGRTRYVTTGPLTLFTKSVESLMGPFGPLDTTEALQPAAS
jgi:glutamate racemase